MNCTKTVTTKAGIFAVVAAGAMVSAVAATCSFPDEPFEMPPIPVAKFADRDFPIADFGAREGIKATDAFAAAMAACEKAGGGRVVSAGDCILPGPSVEAMYHPELHARRAPSRISVKR